VFGIAIAFLHSITIILPPRLLTLIPTPPPNLSHNPFAPTPFSSSNLIAHIHHLPISTHSLHPPIPPLLHISFLPTPPPLAPPSIPPPPPPPPPPKPKTDSKDVCSFLIVPLDSHLCSSLVIISRGCLSMYI